MFKIDKPSAHCNLTGHAVKALKPPAYLWLLDSDVVHLVDPGSFSLQGGVVDQDAIYPVENRCYPNLRCHTGFWLDALNQAYASRLRPGRLRLCRRCVKVVEAALLDLLRVNLVYHITKSVKDHGVELAYHRWGRAYTSDVRPQPGSIPGTPGFYFRSRNHNDKAFNIEVPILNIETWEWATDPTSNPELGQWIGAQIVLGMERLVNVEARILREQIELEEGLFETL